MNVTDWEFASPMESDVMATSIKSVALISHTHLGGEWYLSQRQFQYLRDNTLDEAKELLESATDSACFFVSVSCSSHTPGTQLYGERRHVFLLFVHDEDWRHALIPKKSAQYSSPCFVEMAGRKTEPFESMAHASSNLEEHAGEETWHPTSSHRSAWRRHFGECDGWRQIEQDRLAECAIDSEPASGRLDQSDVVVTALKPTTRQEMRGVILRLFNCAVVIQQVLVRLASRFEPVYVTDFSEMSEHIQSKKNGVCRLRLAALQIANLHLNE